MSAHDDCHRGKLFSNTPIFRTLYLKPSSCSNRKGAYHLAPSLILIGLHSDQSFLHSFEATRDARGAARHNHVTVVVEDFKRNCIGELVRVVTDLNAPVSLCVCIQAPAELKTKASDVRSRTLFSATFGPMMARFSPRATAKDKSWMTIRFPNATVRLLTESTALDL